MRQNDAAAHARRSARAGFGHDCRRRNGENRLFYAGISEGCAERAPDRLHARHRRICGNAGRALFRVADARTIPLPAGCAVLG